jgi:glycosyltransferase involved in cell wall biosynthesis
VRRILFAIPGDIATRSGGYGYDRRVLAALPSARHLPLPGAFPHPSAADVAAMRETLARAVSPQDALLIDGLAYGAAPVDAFASIAVPVIALCHHPLCLETGLSPQRAQALRENEAAALRRADHVVVTSAHTRGVVMDMFGVAADKIAIAPPGVDPAPRAAGAGGTPQLLAVGALIARKGFDLLVDALGGLTHIEWRLDIVGSARHAPDVAAALQRQIDALRLNARIRLIGEASEAEIAAHYARSDIFVSSSLYEGYGMALAEALAAGLPIVATTGGAASETLPDGAAVKIPPGDVAALRDALSRVVGDAALRAQLSEAAWRAGQGLPRWDTTAQIIANVAERFA